MTTSKSTDAPPETFHRVGDGSIAFKRIVRGEGLVLLMCHHAKPHAPNLEQIDRALAQGVPDLDFGMFAVDGRGDSFLFFRNAAVIKEFLTELRGVSAAPAGQGDRVLWLFIQKLAREAIDNPSVAVRNLTTIEGQAKLEAEEILLRRADRQGETATDYITDAEADAYLRGKGIIKKCEVCGQDATLTNEFVTRLAEQYQRVVRRNEQ